MERPPSGGPQAVEAVYDHPGCPLYRGSGEPRCLRVRRY